MPWKIEDESGARRRFIVERLALGSGGSMAALCRRHGISRDCGYKWWRRFCAGGMRALASRPRRTQRARRLWAVWLPRLQQARRQEPSFGAKKLVWQLRQSYPRVRRPSVSTLGRWLDQLGQVRRRKRPGKPGPVLRLAGRLRGRCCNDVWSIDFKGRFRTREGRWVNALTVRDLASRYVLCVQHLDRTTDVLIGRVLRRLFRRYGLPRALRMDNGQPFGAIGPRGWSRLNIQWLKLGIRLEHGRPGCPQDNAEHEQMHGVLKQQTARPAASNVAAQQRRFARWRQWYNHRRPHEHHDQQPPALHYQPSPRRLPVCRTPTWRYPAQWTQLRTDAKGRWRWRGRVRYLGRAFVGERLGARAIAADVLALYLGPHLIGHLHAQDHGNFRAARPVKRRGGASPPPKPSPISLDHPDPSQCVSDV